MRRLTSRALLFIAAILAASAYPRLGQTASLLDFDSETPREILLAQRAIADSVTPAPISEPTATVASPAALTPEETDHRSAGKAFLMNLAVPGAGHLYAGQKRGFVNLGLEGMAWAAYLYYHDRGKSKEKEFETYADGHWDYARWDSTERANGTYNPDADNLIR